MFRMHSDAMPGLTRRILDARPGRRLARFIRDDLLERQDAGALSRDVYADAPMGLVTHNAWFIGRHAHLHYAL